MDYAKLGAGLALAVDDYQGLGRLALRRHVSGLGLVSTETVKGPHSVVFVACAEDADLDRLAAAGLRLNRSRGRLRTGIVALDSLDQLSEDRAIERIIPARRLHYLMDVAAPAVGLPTLRRLTGLTGRGVVVGIIDSGIQAAHPDFAGRVLRIWDQTLPGPGVDEGGYGFEARGPDLDVSRDTNGHGTHVAGIATGGDPTYGGVAPEAELVVVKTDLLDAHIADGIRYVFRVAGEMGRPAVVNLSLGGQADAHDGTDPLSTVVDAESGPGRIVCCAAGNEGSHDIHARATIREGGVETITFALAPGDPAGPAPSVSLHGWYSGGDEVDVALAGPSGLQTPFQPVLTEGSPVRSYELPDGEVRIVTPGPDPANGDHNFLVAVRPPAVRPAASNTPGAWRLRLRGISVADGPVDVWAISEAWAAQFSGSAVGDGLKVGTPGAASRAVTVGSYTTKVEWADLLGGGHQAALELHDVSDFSSEGPRRDGARKPDLTAPGAMIVSSLSADTPVLLDVLIDGWHQIMAGTSMAAPFVSGVVALLLERDPTLDPEAMKQLLVAQSCIPGQDPGAFDPKWGHGLLDAARLGPSGPSERETLGPSGP